MLKKTLSWVLLIALLLSCMIFPSVALDDEKVSEGYQFKYQTETETIYGKFDQLDGNGRDISLESVPAGSTVTLLTDIELNKEIYLRRSLTIDGNGHKVTGATFRTADHSGSVSLTIKNTTFKSTLTGVNNCRYFYQINSGNSCVFENCTFTLSGKPEYGFFVPSGDLLFKNCSLTVTSSDNLSTYTLFHPGNGNKIKATDSTFDIMNAGKLQPGIVVGYNGTYYASCAKAVEQLPAEGGTVTLLTGYEVGGDSSRLQLSYTGTKKNVVFDGNGQTIVGTTASYLVGIGSDMTLKNLNVTQKSENQSLPGAIQVKDGATVTVTNCTLTAEKKMIDGAVAIVQAKSTLILESGAKLTHGGAADSNSASVGVRLNEADASLIVRAGAEITTVGNTVKADVATPSTVTFEGGTISTKRMVWASNKEGNVLKIYGGTFTGEHTSNPLINTYGNNPQVYLCGGTYTSPSGKIFSDQGAIRSLGGTIVLNNTTILKAPGDQDVRNEDAALYLPTNATQTNAGIRFETRLSKEWVDWLTASGATVTTGTLLAPKALVDKLGGLTIEKLNGKGLNITNDGWNNAATAETDGYYRYFGNMIDLSVQSLTGEIAGVGYVTVTVQGYGTVTYYGTVQSGTVREIAKAMASDGLNDAQAEVLDFFAGSQVTTTP